jgi:L-ascorbate metabolism protein UlaG (beta-lactamase superfamily)
MNPEEAVQAFQELGAKYMVPMHYGSFRLSYEPLHEPLERLRRQVEQRRLADAVKILQEGIPTIL